MCTLRRLNERCMLKVWSIEWYAFYVIRLSALMWPDCWTLVPNRRDLDVFNAATFKGNMKLTCAICVTVPTEALPAHSGVFVERYSSRNDVTELQNKCRGDDFNKQTERRNQERIKLPAEELRRCFVATEFKAVICNTLSRNINMHRYYIRRPHGRKWIWWLKCRLKLLTAMSEIRGIYLNVWIINWPRTAMHYRKFVVNRSIYFAVQIVW
jgi:hypothetical protein